MVAGSIFILFQQCKYEITRLAGVKFHSGPCIWIAKMTVLALGLQRTSLQCIFGSNKEMLCFQRTVLTAKYINQGHLTHSASLHFKTALKQNSHCVLTRVLAIYSRTARTATSSESLKTLTPNLEDTLLLGASSL